MAPSKDSVASTINSARATLEHALVELEHLPVFDAGQIAFAAHALSNFLGVIKGTTELLLLSLVNFPDAQVRIRVEGLAHAADLMTHTVHQLMNTSAPSRPRLIYDLMDLSLLVQKACDYYARMAARKGIRMAFAHQEAITAWSDRVAVAAVMDNLLSNAVKYSPPGKRVTVGVTEESLQAVCSIQDEGPGISAQDQKKLFQRGVRLSASPTGGEPSSGYGLAVAKELIDNLGGKLWCTSELGHGACFSFSLPTRPPRGPDHTGSD